MPIITEISDSKNSPLTEIKVIVNRHTLQKKRWRVTAEDGVDIAVELENPCKHGDIVYESKTKAYRVEQKPEDLITLKIPEDTEQSAILGWFLGNQHLPVEVKDGHIRIADDYTVRQLLDRNHFHYHLANDVFQANPHSKTAHHHHH